MSGAMLLIVCAWCERVRTSGDRWEEPGAGRAERSEATHGICSDCLAEETRSAAVSVPREYQ